jgi:hypothetical protein
MILEGLFMRLVPCKIALTGALLFLQQFQSLMRRLENCAVPVNKGVFANEME